MLKSELVKFLNESYNFTHQEEWDNCGPNPTNFKDEKIKKIFISLDMDLNTFKKAIDNNCNVIISHHPILIENTDEEINSNINKTNENLNKLLIDNNILNICLHTCYDNSEFGTSYQIYHALKPILKLNDYSYCDQQNYLLFTELKTAKSVNNLITKINNANLPAIKNLRSLNVNEDKIIKTICIGAGSCASMLDDVIGKADCFLTGDVKWHNYLDALNNNLVIIDINHTAERLFINDINNHIKRKNHNLDTILDYDLIEIKQY